MGREAGGAGSIFTPQSFAPTVALAALRKRAGEYRDKMLAAVAEEGWPPPASAGRVRVVVRPTKRKREESEGEGGKGGEGDGDGEEAGKNNKKKNKKKRDGKEKKKKSQQKKPFVCWRCGVESNKVWA